MMCTVYCGGGSGLTPYGPYSLALSLMDGENSHMTGRFDSYFRSLIIVVDAVGTLDFFSSKYYATP